MARMPAVVSCLVSEAGVSASEPIRAGRIFVDEIGAQTGLALANPSSLDAAVTLTLRDASGKELSRRNLALGRRQQSSGHAFRPLSATQ